jgi:dTDP-4-amino-4,6-dideoxygalactose transaminase
MTVPLLDLVAQYRTIQSDIDRAIRSVLEGGHFVMGPNVGAFEREVAAYVGVDHGIGVASGTDALTLALRAVGIGQGDEVIVPSYTFLATASAVLHVGATPVLVDVDLDTYCIDLEQVATAITAKTRAIIPVHLFGQPVDMAPLMRLAAAHNLKVIEDNAQAFGATDRGRKTGSIGDIGCISFFPSKNLGAFGDGGMVLTSDPEIADRVRILRTHGWRKKYDPEVLGYNSRLDEMQAAILRVKLPYLDEWNTERRRRAGTYLNAFAGTDVRAPVERADSTHVYHLYVVRVPHRAAVVRMLSERGIGSAVYYPVPLHKTVLFRKLASGRSYPVSDRLTDELLAIPLYPEMSDEQQSTVVTAVRDATLATT